MEAKAKRSRHGDFEDRRRGAVVGAPGFPTRRCGFDSRSRQVMQAMSTSKENSFIEKHIGGQRRFECLCSRKWTKILSRCILLFSLKRNDYKTASLCQKVRFTDGKYPKTEDACLTMITKVENMKISCYGQLLSHIPASVYKEICYCSTCEFFFPEIGLHCVSENCAGVGKSFMIANVKELLSNLLKAPGIVEDIKKSKQNEKGNVDSNILTDLHDGDVYKGRLNHRTPSSAAIHLTAILNTDGVNLYSFSRVELWQVFLAINELSPSLRFSRENILLIGLRQGRGKPPFNIFIKYISEEINLLTQNGLDIEIEGENVKVYLTVLCITLDLPAKAGVLNMTLFNGAHACVTCEEPGIVVKQGAGHARSYPYKYSDSRFHTRSNENILQLMNAASDKNRQKGFKGLSGLTYLHEFDTVNGSVPDYMHCILQEIVKSIITKWFSPTPSGKHFFIGKYLKQISERLVKIKPPYYIERLPRDLEKHYSHFKATELQSFLLYYALPCLHCILDEIYLQHFALLSEAIFILLGDRITELSLHRAEQLLEKFYSQFSELYGSGSCGLNVHTVCSHLPYYVKKLGPANSTILQFVHGTGDVTKQVLRNQEISMYIRSLKDVRADNSSMLKGTHVAQNCDVFGSLKVFRNAIPVNQIQTLGAKSNGSLRKALRIFVNGYRFYSEEYSRMKRKNCHIVVYSEDQFGLIQCFLFVLNTNLVYALVKKLNVVHDSWLCTYEAGKQLKVVEVTNTVDVVSVEN
ncbi:hypothetical protein MAR_019898 [Mya arenaria]|uniref:Uncharacterized protein n=1 Tax=Mya arenaria TaxID=6604 RepID=A0ABY7E5S0_MYAAR|nr:hypothetical protein MAR_019898 [Mya arenaria]